MDTACLRHRLTQEERETFEETGIITVDEALTPEHVAHLEQIVDDLFARQVAAGHDPNKTLFYPNFLPDHESFLDLVDYAPILPKVWGLLGWNIYLYHCHLIVTPPSGEEPNDRTLGWHQDSGRVNRDLETSPRPRISLKVAYFLSDTREEGRGNFWVIPGSHLQDDLERSADGIGQPDGAVPVKVKPGTAVFFDRRLWHTASPNWSDVTRKVLFYGYGYRWIRTKDEMTVQHLWEGSDPIRRQLLGDGLSANGYFSPQDGDVPLKTWLEEHAPTDPALAR